VGADVTGHAVQHLVAGDATRDGEAVTLVVAEQAVVEDVQAGLHDGAVTAARLEVRVREGVGAVHHARGRLDHGTRDRAATHLVAVPRHVAHAQPGAHQIALVDVVLGHRDAVGREVHAGAVLVDVVLVDERGRAELVDEQQRDRAVAEQLVLRELRRSGAGAGAVGGQDGDAEAITHVVGDGVLVEHERTLQRQDTRGIAHDLVALHARERTRSVARVEHEARTQRGDHEVVRDLARADELQPEVHVGAELALGHEGAGAGQQHAAGSGLGAFGGGGATAGHAAVHEGDTHERHVIGRHLEAAACVGAVDDDVLAGRLERDARSREHEILAVLAVGDHDHVRLDGRVDGLLDGREVLGNMNGDAGGSGVCREQQGARHEGKTSQRLHRSTPERKG
jgi:hypothetical protein